MNQDSFCASLIFPFKEFLVMGITLSWGLNQNNGQELRRIAQKLHDQLSLFFTASTHLVIYYASRRYTIIQFKDLVMNYYFVFRYHSYFYSDKPLIIEETSKDVCAVARPVFPLHELILDNEHFEKNIANIKAYLTDCQAEKDITSIVNFFSGFCTFINLHSRGRICLQNSYYLPTLEYLLKWVFDTMQQCQLLDSSTPPSVSPYVNQAIRYIQFHYSDHTLTSEKISAQVGLSPGRLGVLFRQHVGKTINEYLTDFRIEKAVHLLQNTNLKVFEITVRCGYKSSQYFSQIFHQKTGKRPIDFRK